MGSNYSQYTQPGAVLYPRMEKKGPFAIDVPGSQKVEGETIPKRNVRCKDGLIVKPNEEISTIYDIVAYGANKYGNAQCIGARKLLDTHVETKKVKKMVDGKEQEVDKKWTYFELSPYSFLSFVEFQKRVNVVGTALKSLGLQKLDKVHLYGSTTYVEASVGMVLAELTRYLV